MLLRVYNKGEKWLKILEKKKISCRKNENSNRI